MKRKITEAEIEAILNKNRYINSENELSRIPLAREQHFLDMIRKGKRKEIKFTDYREIEDHMGYSVRDRHRRFEYTTVAGIALASRAAIEGGAQPDDVYDISDTMLQKLEQAKTVEEMHDILELTGVVLAHAVDKAKKSKNSYILEQCKVFISRNILRKIYLNEIAEYIGINPSYLSRFFSQREGMTIRQYIQKEKIDVSCNLLKYSDRSIVEVAQYVGFQSQSNFTAVFKKWKHESPLEYRNQNKRIVFYHK